MSEQIEQNAPAETAKPEMVRYSIAIPADQAQRLVDDHRFTVKLDKPDYFRHIFDTFEATLDR